MENASKALIIAGAILISILLITIGIVLINSGREVVDTGTAGMNSQKIQIFNTQFTIYEGYKKGTEIRNLVNLVKVSNASDPQHLVTIVGQCKYNEIVDSKTYEVKIFYNGETRRIPSPCNAWAGPSSGNGVESSEAGYINYISVYNQN